MKVGEIVQGILQNPKINNVPVIKADEIKSILYLGIRGDVKLTNQGNNSDNADHTVDVFA